MDIDHGDLHVVENWLGWLLLGGVMSAIFQLLFFWRAGIKPKSPVHLLEHVEVLAQLAHIPTGVLNLHVVDRALQ